MSRPPDPHAKVDLLRAAEEVFLEHGLEKARIEDITGRAHRSKGAFYLHFKSKEDAFKQIVESFIARLTTCIHGSLHQLEKVPLGDFIERCREIDIEVLDFLWQNRGVCRLMLEGGGSSQFNYMIDEFAERSRQNTKRLLRWGVDKGIYRADIDVEIASLVISGAYDRVAREIIRRERKPDLIALVNELQKLLLAGAATPALRDLVDSKVKKSARRA